MGKQQEVFIQDCLQFFLPKGRDTEEVPLLLELTHHISVAQAKQRQDSPNHRRPGTKFSPL